MKNRMHLKNRKKKSHKFRWFLLLIIVILFFLIKKYVNIRPLIISYSEMEANKLATLIINSAIIEEQLDKKSAELYQTNIAAEDVLTINYNTEILNNTLSDLTIKIQNYFGAIEEGNIDDINKSILQKYNYEYLKKGVILYLPLGYLTGSPFLANMGPKIPLKISLIGDVRTDIKTDLKNYGLNNALLKVYIHVEVVTRSILPLVSNVQTTVVEYPIVLKIIQGKVPSYYMGNGL